MADENQTSPPPPKEDAPKPMPVYEPKPRQQGNDMIFEDATGGKAQKK